MSTPKVQLTLPLDDVRLKWLTEIAKTHRVSRLHLIRTGIDKVIAEMKNKKPAWE